MNNMNNMNSLLKLIKKRFSMELRTVTIKGVRNLSRADLDAIELYATSGGHGMMRPSGSVLAVLEKYGYKHPEF